MEVYKKHTFIDANDYMKSVLDTIKIHKNNGDYDKAASVARQNKNILGDQLTASVINGIESELVKIEAEAARRKQNVYVSAEIPQALYKNEIWIGE